MNKRNITVDGRSIDIMDGLLTYSQMQDIYQYALNSKYRLGRIPNDLPENQGYQRTLLCEFTPEEIKQHGFIHVPEIYKYIVENNFRIIRYYVGLSTSSDTCVYHTDSSTEGCKTLLCYLNTKWPLEWEGETHFADTSASDLLASVSFVSGRVVIFDSLIPHKSSQPAVNAEQYRMVLVIKLIVPEAPGYDTSINIEKL